MGAEVSPDRMKNCWHGDVVGGGSTHCIDPPPPGSEIFGPWQLTAVTEGGLAEMLKKKWRDTESCRIFCVRQPSIQTKGVHFLKHKKMGVSTALFVCFPLFFRGWVRVMNVVLKDEGWVLPNLGGSAEIGPKLRPECGLTAKAPTLNSLTVSLSN